MKKVLSIISIVVGGVVLLSVIAPMVIGAILASQASDSVGIIGGADGPTAVFVVGTLGAGSVIIESVIGVLLVAVGIWGLFGRLLSGKKQNGNTDRNELVAFLNRKITEKMSLDDIIRTFESMCRLPVENDMILFETGTYSFSGESLFYFSLVRQIPNDEDEYVQIHVDVLYAPTQKNERFQSSIWNEELEENIFEYIRKSEVYWEIKEDEYIKVNVSMDET